MINDYTFLLSFAELQHPYAKCNLRIKVLGQQNSAWTFTYIYISFLQGDAIYISIPWISVIHGSSSNPPRMAKQVKTSFGRHQKATKLSSATTFHGHCDPQFT